MVPGGVSIVIPARDEQDRLGPCLEALLSVPDPVVREVLVVDDHSTDATADVAREHGATVLAGAALPVGWVGKPWALHQGLEAAQGSVILTLDADARPEPGLVRALATELLAGPERTLLSGAVRFDCRTPGERLLHPALLTSLVLRTGPTDVEGHTEPPHRVIANGQVLCARTAELRAAGGFALAAAAMTDDVALARALARQGWTVRMLDLADLVTVRMYTSVAETWTGWGRSIMAPDVTPPAQQALDVATVLTVQVLPALRLLARRATPVDLALVALRVALLGATRRSYVRRGVPYWLSPLADGPAAVRLVGSVIRPTRTWRGRTYAVNGPAPAAPAPRTAPPRAS